MKFDFLKACGRATDAVLGFFVPAPFDPWNIEIESLEKDKFNYYPRFLIRHHDENTIDLYTGVLVIGSCGGGHASAGFFPVPGKQILNGASKEEVIAYLDMTFLGNADTTEEQREHYLGWRSQAIPAKPAPSPEPIVN